MGKASNNIKEIPILALALVGDSVFDLFVRTRLATNSPARVQTLHKRAVERVNATAQAAAFARIEGMLTPGELAVFRRGKNAKSAPTKNANPKDYAVATGLEALLGHLYLAGEEDRLEQILCGIFSNDTFL